MKEMAKLFADMENGKIMVTYGNDRSDVMIRVMDYVRQTLPEARMFAKMSGGITSWTITM